MRGPLHRLDARVVVLMLAVSTAAFGGFVFWMTSLRESPMFWTYRGAYPIWFREFVRYAYYPALGAYLFATASLAFSMSRGTTSKLGAMVRLFVIGLLGLLGLASLIGAAF